LTRVAEPSRKGRWRSIALAVGLGLASSAVLGELGLRYVLFGQGQWARSLGSSLRRAHYFGDSLSDDDCWTLQHLFADPATRLAVPHPDPLLGWTGTFVTPGSYAHVDAERVRGRTPVLLYGDSFAQCVTQRRRCFQAVLDESDLGDRYAMLNYGVGGYGLDQISLMLARSIDAWVDSDPVVIVGILVEEDLDRSALSFRGWPKPRFELEGGGLALVEPQTTDPDEWVRLNPPRVASYLSRFLTYRRGLLPRALQRFLQERRRKLPEKRELNRRILEQIQFELESRELRYFFFLFHNLEYVTSGAVSEWERLIVDFCAQRSIPVLSARPYLLAAAGGSREACRAFYARAHLTPLGNRVVFEGLRQGLLGRTGSEDTTRIAAMLAKGSLAPELEAPQQREVLGFPALLVNRSRSMCMREENGALWLRAGETGPTELALKLYGRARRLRGSASFQVEAGRPHLSVLEIRTDGRAQVRERFDNERSFELDLDLTGVRELELTVECPDDEPAGWMIIAGASIE
jgi:hypothetical protein